MPFRQIAPLPETPQDRDERLLQEWKRAPQGFAKDQKLKELLDSLSGPIYTAVNQYRSAPLPLKTVELEARRQASLALRDYRSGMGTKLSTFVQTRVQQRLFRYVSEHQNAARIPEEQVRQIGGYQAAMQDLTSRYHREPSTHELADHMGLPVRQVVALRKSLRKDLMSDDETFEDHSHDPDYERAMLAYYDLSSQEKVVFDYLLGAHGQPKLKPRQIAMKLSVSPSRISTVKKNIAKKIGLFLHG